MGSEQHVTIASVAYSLRELEEATGRRSSNLSRTLKTLARYGIVELVRTERKLRPVVKATEFRVTFGLKLPSRPAA